MIRRTPLRTRHQYKPPPHKDPIPRAVRIYVHARDGGCVGRKVGFPTECWGSIEIDHVRASGGIGLKSRSTADNLVSLCSGACHPWKTDHGKIARPLLLDWLERVEGANRCDQIENNGMGEPTECGRTLPCEYHDAG